MAVSPVLRTFRVSNGGQDIETLRSLVTALRNATLLSNNCATATINTATNSLTSTIYKTCGPAPTYSPPVNVISSSTYTFTGITINNFNVGTPLQFIPGGGTNAGQPVTMNMTVVNDGTPYQLTVLPAIGNIRIIQN